MNTAWDCVAAIFMRDMRNEFTNPLGLFSRFVNVLVALYGIYLLADLFDPQHKLGSEHGRAFGYFSYAAINFTFMLLQGTALGVFATAVRGDQVGGALEPILQTQRQALPYVLAVGLWPLTLSALQVALTLCGAALFLRLDFSMLDVGTLALFVCLSTVGMAAIGILSAAIVIAYKRVPPSNYLISGAAPVLAGVMFPVSRLPHGLQIVSWCLPLTHSLHGIRAAFQGVAPSGLIPDIVWLGIAVAILLPLACIALEWATARAKHDGTLSHT